MSHYDCYVQTLVDADENPDEKCFKSERTALHELLIEFRVHESYV